MLSHLPRLFVMFLCFCGGSSTLASPLVWIDVPFVKQEKNGCGAASVAMVMQYWLKQEGRQANLDADASQIHRALYKPAADGVYASAMQRYFQDHGFRTFSFGGEWKDLEQHLHKGRPLIVAIKPPGESSLHYVVVAGIDSEQEILLLNDPARRKLLKQDRTSFEKQWRATDKWMLLALPRRE